MHLQPLSPARMPDFQRLTCFADGACWCAINHYEAMTPELWDTLIADGGAANRATIETCLAQGRCPGVIGYDDAGAAIAWCSVAPIAELPVLHARAAALGAAEARRTAGIVCFSILKEHQGQGVIHPLLEAVIAWARAQGFAALEGYPFPNEVLAQPEFAHLTWIGYPDVFAAHGFVPLEAHLPNRRNLPRPIWRLELAP